MGDPGEDLFVTAGLCLTSVEIGKHVEHLAAVGARHTGRVIQEKNGVFSGAKLHPLMFAREETGTPQVRKQRLHLAAALADHDDEVRQILVGAAEPVGEPRAHRGTTRELMTGLHEGHGGAVIDLLGDHRFDETDFVGHRAGVAQLIGNPQAVLLVSVAGEIEDRGSDRQTRLAGGHAGEALITAHTRRQLFVVELFEAGFMVEGVELRGRAFLEEVDDAFGLGRKMAPDLFRSEQLAKGGAAKQAEPAGTRSFEEPTAVDVE